MTTKFLYTLTRNRTYSTDIIIKRNNILFCQEDNMQDDANENKLEFFIQTNLYNQNFCNENGTYNI